MYVQLVSKRMMIRADLLWEKCTGRSSATKCLLSIVHQSSRCEYMILLLKGHNDSIQSNKASAERKKIVKVTSSLKTRVVTAGLFLPTLEICCFSCSSSLIKLTFSLLCLTYHEKYKYYTHKKCLSVARRTCSRKHCKRTMCSRCHTSGDSTLNTFISIRKL